MNIQAAFILATLSLILWSVMALLLDVRGQRTANRWIAALIAVEILPQGYFYSQTLYPPSGDFHWAVMAQTALWLKGPIGWALTRCVLGLPINRFYPLHFVPFGLAVSDLLFGSHRFDYWSMAGALHAILYLGFSGFMLLKEKPRLRAIIHGFANSGYYWVLWMLMGLAVIIVLNFAIGAYDWWSGIIHVELYKWISGLISFYWIGVAFCSIYRPDIFGSYWLTPANPAAQAEETPANNPLIDTSPTAPSKNWRELNAVLASQLASTLEQLMQQEIYRQHEFSLANLATQLGVSVHQTSELLNVHLGVSFSDYINKARTAYACRALENPQSQLRIIDLAFDAGFSNKNSFYRYFKEFYGTTPLEYKNRTLADAAV